MRLWERWMGMWDKDIFFKLKKTQHGKALLVALNNLRLKYLSFRPPIFHLLFFLPSNSNDTVRSDCLFVLACGQQPLLGDHSWPRMCFSMISPLQQCTKRVYNGWNMVSKKSNKGRSRGSRRATCERQCQVASQIKMPPLPLGMY